MASAKLLLADSLSLWNWLQALTLGVLFGFHGNSEIQKVQSSNLTNLEIHVILLLVGAMLPWRFIIISGNKT